MHLLRQTFFGFLIVWIVYAIFMGVLEWAMLKGGMWFLEEHLAYTLVFISGPISGILTAILAKRKEWLSNTIVGVISAMGPVVYLILNSRVPLSLSDKFWYISLGAIHSFCFSLTGFFIQKRRLDKLKDYNVTDQRIDSFGEKFKERK